MQLTQSNINQIKDFLFSSFYDDNSPERVGYIKGKNEVIEVKNISNIPYESFAVSGEDILKYTSDDKVWATWHTHPKEDSNLSGEDYVAFMNFPELLHFVIGHDGVTVYKVNSEKNIILKVDLNVYPE